MRTRLSFILSAGAALVLGGCGLLDSLAAGCDASYNFGLAVYVRDSVTGAGIASGAQLVVNGVGYVDSVSVPEARPDLDSLAIPSAGERPGLYIVTVRKDSYHEWTSKPVHVTEDGCHVRLTRVTARLQRAS